MCNGLQASLRGSYVRIVLRLLVYSVRHHKNNASRSTLRIGIHQ